MNLIEETLKNFLNIYWIRPEIAIWRTLDVVQLSSVKFRKPVIDLGCGDGTFCFTKFGGKVDYSFDVYKTMKNTKGFFNGKDIHDQKFVNKPKILKKSKIKIDVGLDWKNNLLNKAENLSIYEKTIQHNLDKTLPFENKKFETIFSNVFYWMKNIDNIISESKRILSDSGEIIILVPDKNFKDNLIYQEFLKNKYIWAKMLDRGIYQNISKHCYSFEEWKKKFSKNGLKIKEHKQYLSKKFIKFWSIGMRPYSPYIIEMANKLPVKERTQIKKRLIKELSPLIISYINTELKSTDQKCFHLFKLEKS